MKHILLPTDFSENSLHAIEYAMQLFKNRSCDFYLLNVQKSSEYITDDIITAPEGTTIYQSIAGDNKKELEQLIEKLGSRFAKEEYTFHSLFDFDTVSDAVQQAVISKSIELIIMGTNGATGAKEVLFGSNTLQVMRSTKCPVLAIPEWCSFNGLKSILFSTFESEDFNIKGVTALRQLLEMHSPELNVLEINDDAISLEHKEDDERVSQLFKDIPYTFHTLSGISYPIAINAFTQLMKPDLHALFIEPASFWERFFFGSEGSRISYGTRIPILILHK